MTFGASSLNLTPALASVNSNFRWGRQPSGIIETVARTKDGDELTLKNSITS